MEILQKDDGKKGIFFIEQDGNILAEMTYVWAGEKIIIDHTEVSEVLEGKGIGKQLVHRAVEFARGKHIKILPLCPFAKVVLNKVSEYHDVVL